MAFLLRSDRLDFSDQMNHFKIFYFTYYFCKFWILYFNEYSPNNSICISKENFRFFYVQFVFIEPLQISFVSIKNVFSTTKTAISLNNFSSVSSNSQFIWVFRILSKMSRVRILICICYKVVFFSSATIGS